MHTYCAILVSVKIIPMKNPSFETIADCLLDLVTDENVSEQEIITFLHDQCKEIHEYFKQYSDKSKAITDAIKPYAICDI